MHSSVDCSGRASQVVLSILIPVFNVEAYLPALLDKLLPNLPDQVEVIFYDDVSPDQSVAIIQQYQQLYSKTHIKLLRGEKNIGITQVRQQLLLASQAAYVWFIDSDDCVEAGAAEQILGIIGKCKPDVILFDYDVFYDDGGLKYRETLSLAPVNTLLTQKPGQLYCLAIMDGKHYFWNKVFLRKLVIDACQFSIPAYEDIANTPKILNLCQTYYYYSKTLIHYRIWSNSIVQKMSIKQAYGIEAYITQAIYARNVVRSRKCCAYLSYKAYIYYKRLCRKIIKSELPESVKYDFLDLSKKIYGQNPFSLAQIIGSLLLSGMWGKAAKILVYAVLTRKLDC